LGDMTEFSRIRIVSPNFYVITVCELRLCPPIFNLFLLFYKGADLLVHVERQIIMAAGIFAG